MRGVGPATIPPSRPDISELITKTVTHDRPLWQKWENVKYDQKLCGSVRCFIL